MTTAETVREEVSKLRPGEPFAGRTLQGLGSRASVDQALSRLAKSGELRRVCQGIYMRPRTSRLVGEVPPSPAALAKAIAESTGEILQVHGAEAARRLELTQQVQLEPFFETSGYSRDIAIGNLTLRLRHVSPKRLALAGTLAGTALTALRYMGQNQVTIGSLQHVRERLPEAEFQRLAQHKHLMPAWLAELFRQFEAA